MICKPKNQLTRSSIFLKVRLKLKLQNLESKQGKTNNAEKEAQLTRQIAEMQQKLADLNDAKS